MSVPEDLSGSQNEIPFVGLRPFEADESYLFFGRGKQILELLQKLHTTRFIGVVGSSGCGKSSLIKAGLIPKLKAGFLAEDRDHWTVASMRPEDDPLACLAGACNRAFSDIPGEYPEITVETIRNEGFHGLLALTGSVLENTSSNLLLLVDQFEELFTSRVTTESQLNDHILFVNILLSLAKQRAIPVYVVITMRSDYIGNCNKFFELPETLNKGQYLVPRLSRTQLAEVIELPIRLFGQKIAPRLLDLLLNEADTDNDQLPVLQHCLMRTYYFWQKENTGAPIDFEHYERAGKLQNALSDHANGIFNTLSDDQKKIARIIFRNLTDVNADNEPVRRRRHVDELVAVCHPHGASYDDVTEIIDVFRDPTCAFLTPFKGKIDDRTVIDISHESLLRQWSELREWIRQEQDSVRKYRWLSDSVRDSRECLRGIDLRDALAWQAREKPVNVWASRYSGNFHGVEKYLEESKRQIRSKRIRNISFLCLLGASIIFGGGLWIDKLKSDLNRFDQAKTSEKLKHDKQRALDSAAFHKKQATLIRRQHSETQRHLKQIELQKKMLAIGYLKMQRTNSQLRVSNAQLKVKNQVIENLNRGMSFEINSNRFRESKFSQSQLVDSASKASGQSYILPYLDDSVRYASAFQALNTIAFALDTAESDPYAGVEFAMKAWRIDSLPVVKVLALKLINSHLFYATRSKNTNGNQGTSSFGLANNSGKFRFNSGTSIEDGTIGASGQIILAGNGNKYRNQSAPGVKPAISSLVYVDSLHSMAIENGKVVEWVGAVKNDYGMIPNYASDNEYRISPDGRFLLAISPKRSAELYNINRQRAGKSRTNERPKGTITLNGRQPSRRPAFSAAFSQDNSQIALGHLNGASLWDKEGGSEKNIANSPEIKEAGGANSASLDISQDLGSAVTAICFSPTGDSLILATYGGKIQIWDIMASSLTEVADLSKELDTLGNAQRKPQTRPVISWLDFNKNQVLAGTSDGRKMIYYDLNDGDKIAKRMVYKNGRPVRGYFFTSNSIISLDSAGYILLWKPHAKFTNINRAFAAIRYPDLPDAGKVRNDDYFAEALRSTDAEQIINYAADYRRSSLSQDQSERSILDAQKAKMLYERIATLNPGDKANKLYADSLIYALNNELISMEMLKAVPDYSQIVARYKENAQIGEAQLDRDPQNKALKNRVSKVYWKLSWFQLFVKEYTGAVQSAQKGFEIDSVNDGIITNKALGHVLSKNFAEADKIYTNYINRKRSDGKWFRNVFLKDFDDLERAGIITLSQPKIYSYVANMRKKLKKRDHK